MATQSLCGSYELGVVGRGKHWGVSRDCASTQLWHFQDLQEQAYDTRELWLHLLLWTTLSPFPYSQTLPTLLRHQCLWEPKCGAFRLASAQVPWGTPSFLGLQPVGELACRTTRRFPSFSLPPVQSTERLLPRLRNRSAARLAHRGFCVLGVGAPRLAIAERRASPGSRRRRGEGTQETGCRRRLLVTSCRPGSRAGARAPRGQLLALPTGHGVRWAARVGAGAGPLFIPDTTSVKSLPIHPEKTPRELR